MSSQGELNWKKSSASNGTGGNCVEVARLADGAAALRDSKDNGAGAVLYFSARNWSQFLSDIKVR